MKDKRPEKRSEEKRSEMTRREKKQDKRREEKRREMTRREKKQDKRRVKMKRERDEIKDFFQKKIVSRPSNQPDELAQHVSKKKSLSDELFLHFFFESSESGRFSIIYMIRIRFFGPQELNQKGFSGEQ